METINFRPSGRYLVKLYMRSLFIGGIVLFFGTSLMNGISGNDVFSPIQPTAIMIAFVLQVIVWFFVTLYYATIKYEVHEDEVIVRSGILTKVVTHVPFRTITNINTTRDFVDQLLGIGSLSIQTAGSGSIVPEEKLAGVSDLDGLYSYVAQELRRFRTDTTPNQSGNAEQPINNERVLLAILQELRAIRQELRNA